MTFLDKVPYLRRFAGKIVEMAAAGIGTAVTGYLVAYVTGHLSFFSFLSPATVEHDPPKQAISSAATPQSKPQDKSQDKPQDTASIEATVRAALASHDGSQTAAVAAPQPAAPVVATAQPAAPASPEAQISETATSAPPIAPPLATAEIRSMPVAAGAPLAAEPEGWPSDPQPIGSTGRLGGLPPQPPPVNGNLFSALKRFF